MRNVKGSTILVAVVALVALAVAGILGSAVAGIDPDRVAYLITGLIAPTVVTLLTLVKLDQAAGKVDETKAQVAGAQAQIAELHEVVVNGQSNLRPPDGAER